MNIPLQSATTWKAVVTVLQLLAIAITALRLFLRHRRQTLWVDDITVALALVMELVGMIVMWFVYVQDDNSTVKGRVALYWFASIAWITTLWPFYRYFPATWLLLRPIYLGMALAPMQRMIGLNGRSQHHQRDKLVSEDTTQRHSQDSLSKVAARFSSYS
uniref:Uncharacterized protein n=1 Tax=Psilocybe cubensis TaxID=181762 RepID=A0A8H7XS46_PSICU